MEYFVGDTKKKKQFKASSRKVQMKVKRKLRSRLKTITGRTTQEHLALLYVEELHISTDFCNPEVN